jgi:hypothetical protein
VSPRSVAKRREEPPLQVHARLMGSFEFMCPDCGKLCVIPYPNWRTGRTKCMRRKRCGHGFQSGLLFSPEPFPRTLAKARCEPLDPRVANAIEPLAGTWVDLPGHVLGPVEWWCPDCGARSQDIPLWDDGLLCCPAGHIWYCGLLLSRPESGFNAITPLDWVPPYGLAPDDVGAAADPATAGPDRDRPRDPRQPEGPGDARPAESDR